MSFSNWEDLFQYLSSPESHHNPRSDEYIKLKREVRHEVEKQFAKVEPEGIQFGPFGKLVFPYFQMGNIDSLNLFDIDELIIFSYYYINRDTYNYAT